MDANYYQARHSLHNGLFINDGFFPDLDLVTLQKRHRIDTEISIEALYGSVLETVTLINRDLYPWVCSQVKKGYLALQDVPCPTYAYQYDANSEPISANHYETLYQQAIFFRVKADLTRENSHHTLSKEGIRRDMRYTELSDDFYRRSTWAVRMIKGKRTTRVRLL